VESAAQEGVGMHKAKEEAAAKDETAKKAADEAAAGATLQAMSKGHAKAE
jgi:hypothetical protein